MLSQPGFLASSLSSCFLGPVSRSVSLFSIFSPPSAPASHALTQLGFEKTFPKLCIFSSKYLHPLPFTKHPVQHVVLTWLPSPLSLFSAQSVPFILEFALFTGVIPATSDVPQAILGRALPFSYPPSGPCDTEPLLCNRLCSRQLGLQ